ncbi:MAG: E3 binding domain-containing protein, partial [Eubacterium sp.]
MESAAAQEEPEPEVQPVQETQEEKSKIVTVSPLAERIAAEENIDIRSIGQGSGPDGRIMKEDVLQAIEKGLGQGSDAPMAPEPVIEARELEPVVEIEKTEEPPEEAIEESVAELVEEPVEILAQESREESIEEFVQAPE